LASNPKYQYADMDKVRETQKEALEDFASRIKSTGIGAIKGIASDHINNIGNATYGEIMRQNQQMSGEIKGWQDTISAYQDALSNASSTKSERETAQTVINDLQRRINAYQGAYGSNGANERAGQAAWNAADRLDNSAKQNVDRAKEGLGRIGQGAVDLGVLGVETLSDRLSPVAIYSKLFRLMGRDSQKARRSGADYNAAMSYGGASGFSGAAIETLFDGLNGVYGKGMPQTEKWAENIRKRLGLSEATEKRIKARLDDLGEGIIESPLTDAANQMSKSAYNGKDVDQNLSEIDRQQIATNAIINTILAVLLEESD